MKLIIINRRSGSATSAAPQHPGDASHNTIDSFTVSLPKSLIHNAIRELVHAT